MKKLILTITVLMLFSALACHAQNPPEGYVYVDSLIYTPVSAVDSTLKGRSIWDAMPENVIVHQSREAGRAVDAMKENNAGKTCTVYRIRIFFDNKQNARTASEETVRRFRSIHPGIAAYRSFSYPFFKVTVGDYRTKSEALAALGYIKPDFPSAFILKEKIKFPAINNTHAVIVDTVKILKPLYPTRANGQ